MLDITFPFRHSECAVPDSIRATRLIILLSPPSSGTPQQSLSSPQVATKHSCRCNTPAAPASFHLPAATSTSAQSPPCYQYSQVFPSRAPRLPRPPFVLPS